MSGHTLALDEILRAAPPRHARDRFLARRRDPLLRSVRLEGRHDRGHGARTEGEHRAAEQRGHGAAVGRRGAGGHGARERPALSAAPHQGRRARADAAVQREHPRVAERRPGGARPQRPRRPLEPPDGGALRRPPRVGGRPGRSTSCSTRGIVADDQGAGDGAAEGTAHYRIPMSTRHEPPRRLLVNLGATPLRDSHADVVGSIVIVEDISTRVQLEEQLQISEKMASIGLLAAGVAHEVNTPLTGISSFTQMLLENARARRSVDAGAGEDRAADVPRGEDRQRAAEPGASGAGRQRPVRHQRRGQRRAVAARAPVPNRQHPGPQGAGGAARRWCRGSSTSCSRCS